jgi:hypothetical protein
MKKLLAIGFWLLIAGSAMAAVNLKFQWDVKPGGDTRTSVRIYERTGTGPYTFTQVAEVAEPAVTVTVNNVTPGVHSYVARGWNGQEESGDSNLVTSAVLAAPGIPTTVTITVVIQ